MIDKLATRLIFHNSRTRNRSLIFFPFVLHLTQVLHISIILGATCALFFAIHTRGLWLKITKMKKTAGRAPLLGLMNDAF